MNLTVGDGNRIRAYGRSTKDIPPLLQDNAALYAGIIQLYRRGTVRVLEESADGVFVQDTHGISYMLAASDLQPAKEWLRRHADRGYDLIMVIDDELTEYARAAFGFCEQMDVYQAVYEETRPLTYDARLDVIPAGEKDMDFVRKHYSNLDEEELAGIIRDRNLFLGYSGGACVGFIGQHLEGSMGLLEILPKYRRKGYGAELERFMINNMLADGLIPYCQFQTDNTASRTLQEKLGLRILPERITWLFRNDVKTF